METKVKSFLSTAKKAEGDGVPLPLFEGEGRTDLDGTAVFLAAGSGRSGQKHPAEATQEFEEDSTDDDGHDSIESLRSRAYSALEGNSSDGRKADEMENRETTRHLDFACGYHHA